MNFCYIKNNWSLNQSPESSLSTQSFVDCTIFQLSYLSKSNLQYPLKAEDNTSCHVAYASHGDQRNGRWTNVALNPPTRPFTSPLESQAEELSWARTNLVNAKREFQNNEKSLKELLHPLDEEENRMSRVEFRDVTRSPLGKRLVHECV